eukprot:225884-Rhodomonas_salina.2
MHTQYQCYAHAVPVLCTRSAMHTCCACVVPVQCTRAMHTRSALTAYGGPFQDGKTMWSDRHPVRAPLPATATCYLYLLPLSSTAVCYNYLPTHTRY